MVVGTGIGGGIVIDGALYRGANGVAGEIGHMCVNINGPKCGCGNHGCLHMYASGTAIRKQALKSLAASRKIGGGIIDLIGGKIT